MVTKGSFGWRSRLRRAAAIFPLLAVFFVGFVGSARAEFYKWVDKNGRMHFTNNFQELPPEVRARLKYRGKRLLRKKPSAEAAKPDGPAVEDSKAGTQAPTAGSGQPPAKSEAEKSAKASMKPEEAVERILTKEFVNGYKQKDVPKLLVLMTKDFSFKADGGTTLSRRGYGSRLERFFDRLTVREVEVRSVRVRKGAGTLTAKFRFILRYELTTGQRRMRKGVYSAEFRKVEDTWRIDHLRESGLQDYPQEG